MCPACESATVVFCTFEMTLTFTAPWCVHLCLIPVDRAAVVLDLSSSHHQQDRGTVKWDSPAVSPLTLCHQIRCDMHSAAMQDLNWLPTSHQSAWLRHRANAAVSSSAGMTQARIKTQTSSLNTHMKPIWHFFLSVSMIHLWASASFPCRVVACLNVSCATFNTASSSFHCLQGLWF